MTFLEWLSTQKGRNDPIGDFAYDALSVKDAPTSSSLRVWLAYLGTRQGVCKEAVQALKDAHEEYSKTESGNDPADHVYVWGGEGIYKIGRAKNPLQRVRSFPIMPYPTGFAHILLTNDSKRLERQLHVHFKRQRMQGEWFKLSAVELATIPSLANVPIIDKAEFSTKNTLWYSLARLEPRLQALYDEAKAIEDNSNANYFCANDIWYEQFKPRLCSLVGWDVSSPYPKLRTDQAYDAAYDKVYGALPDCRNCSCILPDC